MYEISKVPIEQETAFKKSVYLLPLKLITFFKHTLIFSEKCPKTATV